MSDSSLTQTLARLGRMLNASRFAEVEAQTRDLERSHPDDPRVLFLRAVAIGRCGRRAEARAMLTRAILLEPGVTAYSQMLAYFHMVDEQFNDAHRTYDAALSRRPAHLPTIALKAELHIMQREYDKAASLLEGHVGGDEVDPAIARAYGRLAPVTGREEHAIAVLRRVLGDPALDRANRAHGLYMLASLLDRTERHDDAFRAASDANSLQPATHDARAHTADVTRIITAWSADRYAALPRLEDIPTTLRPVFIIGILRSGSSLLEQVLDAHPGVHATGEWPVVSDAVSRSLARSGGAPQAPVHPAALPPRLTPEILRDVRARILDAAAERVGAGTTACVITNKALGNFNWLGLISLIFPGAPVLICVRNHLDTCISAFFQNLNNTYTHRLADMAHYCRDVDRLVNHWRTFIPNPMIAVHYEEMAQRQEATTRAVLDFIGLPWDEACLRFHEHRRVTVTVSNQQVTRPMYTSSVGRSRYYGAYLGEAATILGEPVPAR